MGFFVEEMNRTDENGKCMFCDGKDQVAHCRNKSRQQPAMYTSSVISTNANMPESPTAIFPTFVPRMRYAVPQTTVAAPRPTVVATRPTVVAPRPTVVAPRPKVVAPRPTVVAPQPTMVAPRSKVVAPRPTVVAPRPTVVAPRPKVVAPRPTMVAPQPPVVALMPTMVVPPPMTMPPHEFLYPMQLPQGMMNVNRLPPPPPMPKLLQRYLRDKQGRTFTPISEGDTYLRYREEHQGEQLYAGDYRGSPSYSQSPFNQKSMPREHEARNPCTMHAGPTQHLHDSAEARTAETSPEASWPQSSEVYYSKQMRNELPALQCLRDLQICKENSNVTTTLPQASNGAGIVHEGNGGPPPSHVASKGAGSAPKG